MSKYFDLDNKKVNADLRKRGCVDLDNTNGYHLDYGNCTLTCVHSTRRNRNIEIPGIIRGGLCYTQPIILPDLPKSHPHASILNSSRLAYLSDENFCEEVDALTLKYIYQHQQKQHEDLMEVLTHIPETFHTLPYHMWGTEQVLVDSLSDEARSHLWHQRLIHCGEHSMKDAHKHIEGVPNMSKFSFNDLTRCATCIKSKLTKNSPGHRSLRDSLSRAYQGLYVDFGFAERRSRDEHGNIKESSRTDIEGLNGEVAWILVSDGKTRMLHGDTRLSKASPLAWLESFLSEYSPECKNKWVVMDQGGEMFNNPKVVTLF